MGRVRSCMTYRSALSSQCLQCSRSSSLISGLFCLFLCRLQLRPATGLNYCRSRWPCFNTRDDKHGEKQKEQLPQRRNTNAGERLSVREWDSRLSRGRLCTQSSARHDSSDFPGGCLRRCPPLSLFHCSKWTGLGTGSSLSFSLHSHSFVSGVCARRSVGSFENNTCWN